MKLELVYAAPASASNSGDQDHEYEYDRDSFHFSTFSKTVSKLTRSDAGDASAAIPAAEHAEHAAACSENAHPHAEHAAADHTGSGTEHMTGTPHWQPQTTLAAARLTVKLAKNIGFKTQDALKFSDQ